MKICFGVVGVLCLVFCVLLSVRRMRTLWHGAVARGTVVRLERRESEDSISHFPVISYFDITGAQCSFTSTSGVDPAAFPVGTSVPVRYSRRGSRCAYIASWRHMWGAPAAMLLLGMAGIWAALA